MNRRVCAIAALMLIAACSDSLTGHRAMPATPTASDAAAPTAAMEIGRPMMLEQVASPPALPDRKVIRTAEIRIQLDDVAAGSKAADSIATALSGLVASSHISQGDRGETESQLTIRVPTVRFADALAALRTLGRVRVDNTNAEDVTRAYSDLEIRLAVKRDLVNRLRALLATRTAKLSDIIEVERELGRAITELEQMEGERRYLDNQVSMSTIQASFFHAPVAGPGSFLDPILVAIRQSVAVLGRSIAALISWTVFVIPWVVIAVVGWHVARFARRRYTASREPAAANT